LLQLVHTEDSSGKITVVHHFVCSQHLQNCNKRSENSSIFDTIGFEILVQNVSSLIGLFTKSIRALFNSRNPHRSQPIQKTRPDIAVLAVSSAGFSVPEVSNFDSHPEVV
jgi:hypothetical protein